MASAAAFGESRMNGFDLRGSLIAEDEIHAGGPPRDGIPAIDSPRFERATAVRGMSDDDRVLGLVYRGTARAYPISIMNWHEVINDRFGEDGVAVTYCPLCGTGVAFATGSGGDRTTFGVSGLLYNSDVLLYDRETESLWSQLMMQAVSGSRKGERLNAVPLTHTRWADWVREYPQTRVLSRDTGFKRDYDSSPYAGYSAADGLFFPVRATSARYHPKEQVLGLEIAGRFKAYAFSELARSGATSFQDDFAERSIRIEFDAEARSARAYDEQGALMPSVTAFWFAWYGFHPETEIFSPDS